VSALADAIGGDPYLRELLADYRDARDAARRTLDELRRGRPESVALLTDELLRHMATQTLKADAFADAVARRVEDE
jgi:hypothetical protein